MGSRHLHRNSWIALVAFACLAAQLALASATLWHHHHDADGDDHQDCAVCMAVIQAKTDATPMPVIVPAPLQFVEVIAPIVPADPSVAAVWTIRARGPPTA